MNNTFMTLLLILSFVPTFVMADVNCDKIRNDELSCLACNLYHEARGETKADQLMVGHTTVNRAASPYYPDNICDVVWQNRQFSWTQDGKSDIVTEKNAWKLAKELASIVLMHHNDEYYNVIPKNAKNIETVLWFYNPEKVNPTWANAKVEVIRTSGHRFMAKPEDLNLAQN